MHFLLLFVSINLFVITLNCIPLNSFDSNLLLPDTISSDSPADLPVNSDTFLDANSYSPIFNDAELPNSDSFTSSLSESLIATSNVDDSNVNSLLQTPDIENTLSDSTDPYVFSDATAASDILEESQNWLEPSLTLAKNPEAPLISQVSTAEIYVCCGHGESLQYYCQKYDKKVQTCNQASILCPADLSVPMESYSAAKLDQSKCHPDPESRQNVDESDDFFHALGQTLWNLGSRVGFGFLACQLVDIFWKCT